MIRGSVDRANIYLSVIDGAAFGSEEEELADLCAAPTGPSPLAQHAHPRIFTIEYFFYSNRYEFVSSESGRGLIYATRRAECERIADALQVPT